MGLLSIVCECVSEKEGEQTLAAAAARKLLRGGGRLTGRQRWREGGRERERQREREREREREERERRGEESTLTYTNTHTHRLWRTSHTEIVTANIFFPPFITNGAIYIKMNNT